MANEISISATTGLTLSLQLYSGTTPVGAPFGATEIGSTGEYVASMPAGVAYGTYTVIATSSGNKIGSGQILWDGAYEITMGLSIFEGLNASAPMNVTPTARTAGSIVTVISGDGTTTATVTRS